MRNWEVLIGPAIAGLIALFIWFVVAFVQEVGEYREACAAKGGVVLETESKYMCVKADAIIQ